MKLFKIPYLITLLFSKATWNVSTKKKEIYLTFDDGPVPGATEYVLEELKKYKAKATFFCIGDNINKHPSIFKQVKDEGHSIGNHTYNHLNGRKISDKTYFQNIEKCQQFTNTDLFRPPYGKLRYSQYKMLSNKYNIVMWNVLSYDFDQNLNKDIALNNIIKHTKKGSIIVFHDSKKALDNLKVLLPNYLEHFSKLGYEFRSL